LGLNAIVESEPTPGWLNFKASENVDPTTIFQLYKSDFGFGTDDDMVLIDSFTDEAGFTNYFYKQTYKGVEIVNAQFSIVAKNGMAIKGNGTIHSNHGFINTNPSISYTNAVTNATNYLDSSQNWENLSPTLQETKIYSDQNSNFYLGYRIFLGSQNEHYSVFVNSVNGNVEDLLEMGHHCGSSNITGNIDCTDHLDKYINLVISEQVNTTEIDGICVYKDTDRSNLTLVYNEGFLDLNNDGTNDFNPQLQYPDAINGVVTYYYTQNEEFDNSSQCQNTVNPTECSYFVNGVVPYFLGVFSYDYYIQLLNDSNINIDFRGGKYGDSDPQIVLKDYHPQESVYFPTSNAIFISKSHANTDIFFHEFNHLLNTCLDGYGLDLHGPGVPLEERKIANSFLESFADVYAIIIIPFRLIKPHFHIPSLLYVQEYSQSVL